MTKSIFLLLVSLLAICSFAAVPNYERRSAELPAHRPSILSFNSTANSDPEFDTSHTFDNATSASLTTSSAWPSDEFAVDIRVGGTKQHVGTLHKQRLHKAVYDCLKLTGEEGHGTKPGQKNPDLRPEVCYDTKWMWCQIFCNVPNIVYDAGGNSYATNAHLKMEMYWSELYESRHAGIRHLTYKLVSDIYRLATENDENCYWVNFTHSRKTKICNVPKNVLVVWPARGPEAPQARMSFTLSFNGATINHKVNCESGRKNITKHFKYHARSEVARVMNWKEEKIRLFNSCQEEACFDVREGYHPGEPWHEPKGCKVPEKYEDMEGV